MGGEAGPAGVRPPAGTPEPRGPHLGWIDERRDAMLQTLLALSTINSGSENLEGLARTLEALESLFAPLGGCAEVLELPPRSMVDDRGEVIQRPLGRALRIRKRPDAPLRVFLGGHMDTVFPREHPFQHPRRLADGRINGPGVADLKGGLVVMCTALEALERSPWARGLGWEVLINPDEEIGSPGSAHLLTEAARRNHLGLVYEPALPDGRLAGARKGSGNFTAVVRGRAAHAGREHHLGRNAIRAVADFIRAVDELNGQRPGVTVNPGQVLGGGPVNIVPDLAVVRFNVRIAAPDDEDWVLARLHEARAGIDARDGLSVAVHGGFGRKPKVLDASHKRLFELVRRCGGEEGLDIDWTDTGGCCDGNNLAAAGLPNVDTLGVRGGAIHSAEEYLWPESLTERARLSARLLLGLASGELAWPASRP